LQIFYYFHFYYYGLSFEIHYWYYNMTGRTSVTHFDRLGPLQGEVRLKLHIRIFFLKYSVYFQSISDFWTYKDSLATEPDL
jgi:hypothetical protein